MKRTISTIIFLSSIICISGQLPNQDIFWIATESKQLKDDGIFPFDGMILNFKQDSVWIFDVFSDSSQAYTTMIRNNILRVGGEKWGKISFYNKDSLLLNVDSKMQVKFLPIRNTGAYSGDTDFWNNTEYFGITKKGRFELLLTNEPWGVIPNENAKLCIIQVEGERYKGSNTEKWNMKVVNGMHILAISDGHFEPQVFLIQEYDHDTASVAFLSNPFFKGSRFIETFSIIRKPIIDSKHFKAIEEQINGKLWKSNKVLGFSSRYNQDSLEDEYDMMGFHIIDTILYRKESLVNNDLSFEFLENGEFRTYEGQEFRLKGEWKLSPSGKQIILYKGFGPSNYIDIITLEPDKLIIGKLDRFAVTDRKRQEEGFVEYYYKLELTE